MPTAPDWLRDKWGGYEGVGEDKAMSFLEAGGYELGKDWHWRHGDGAHEPTEDEREAALFLITEWDFGCILTEK